MAESNSRIKSSALPEPTYLPQDPTKKSHARKQPKGHVPRPRNAFILFRCDFVRQKKVPEDVENDHRNISRIAGGVWREMTDEDKAPWVQMAEQEKITHSQVHPGYRYTPHVGAAAISRRKKRGDVPHEAESLVVAKLPELRTLRRSSSCPSLPELQPQYDSDLTRQLQRHFYLSPLTPRISTRRQDLHNGSRVIQHAHGEKPFSLTHYRRDHDYIRDWQLNSIGSSSGTTTTTIPIPKQPSPTTTSEATIESTYAADKVTTPSFLSLRRPSSCPPGAQRISSAQLTHPSGTSAFQMTRDDLSRRPSRVPMYQASPIASAFPEDQQVAYPTAFGSPFTRDLGRNTRPQLLTGPYRIDPPRDLPGWDAAPPQPYPWKRGWGEEDIRKASPFDLMGIPQDSLEGSSKADLDGVSRAELWNILSHVDVGEMVQRDDSESPHPPRPQFTNPFSAIADPPFTGFYLPVAPLYSSTNNEQIPLGSPFDPRSRLASLKDRSFTTPRHFLAHHESLIGQLFPRMSLDGGDSSTSDKINAGTMEADEDVAFGRYAGLQDTPDFPLDSQQSGFGLSTR